LFVEKNNFYLIYLLEHHNDYKSYILIFNMVVNEGSSGIYLIGRGLTLNGFENSFVPGTREKDLYIEDRTSFGKSYNEDLGVLVAITSPRIAEELRQRVKQHYEEVSRMIFNTHEPKLNEQRGCWNFNMSKEDLEELAIYTNSKTAIKVYPSFAVKYSAIVAQTQIQKMDKIIEQSKIYQLGKL